MEGPVTGTADFSPGLGSEADAPAAMKSFLERDRIPSAAPAWGGEGGPSGGPTGWGQEEPGLRAVC